MVTRAIREKHPLAKRAKAFLDGDWSRTFNHWLEFSRRGRITDAAIDELLGFFHHSLYPAADDAGFPDTSFVFPDIELPGKQYRYPVPQFAVSGWTDAFKHLLQSKEAKEMVPFIPYLGTLDKINTLIHDAKEGDPIAVEKVKEVKARADLGDPAAKQTATTMAVVSKAQDLKTAKSKSFYARGMSVGHDFVSIGATRRHSTRSQQGLSASNTAMVADHRGGASPSKHVATLWTTPVVAPTLASKAPTRTKLPPMPVTPPTPQDPYGVPQDPYAPQGYGGYPMDPYGMNPYGGYGYPGFDPYALPGLPPGYGYEEPVIDRGGFQQYDPTTDSFYSSNQKQVYDEATGMFYPANAENPYASLYGF